MNEDYVEGWKAARAYYQATGGVPPFPPGYVPKTEEEAPPAPTKKATRKPKEA